VPTKVLKLRGSRWAKGRGENEPELPESRPPAPDYLCDEGKAHYEAACDVVQEMGILTAADQTALARYAATIVLWREAYEFIRKHGTTFPVKELNKKTGKTVTTGLREWPQVSLVRSAADQLLKLEREFGLTPSARSSIQLSPESKPVDPKISKFFTKTS
tara:strand:- start:415 stop:894 length:480 start_codon:yes stop_codon:yes gene_type:complete